MRGIRQLCTFKDDLVDWVDLPRLAHERVNVRVYWDIPAWGAVALTVVDLPCMQNIADGRSDSISERRLRPDPA